MTLCLACGLSTVCINEPWELASGLTYRCICFFCISETECLKRPVKMKEGSFLFPLPHVSGHEDGEGIVNDFSLCLGGPGCRERNTLWDSGFLFAPLRPQPVYGASTFWMSHYPSVKPLEVPLKPHLHLCGHLLDESKSCHINNIDFQSRGVNYSWSWSIYLKPTCRGLTFIPLFKLQCP